ncbi:hypothetical protein Vretifemale_18491 [Volvox reticuliferus]|nr:hypothetical protein Vretifemale_18491 [Volvox reticuliferus]
MAVPQPLANSLEYLRVFDLPPASSLPEELQGCILFSKGKFIHANSNVARRSNLHITADVNPSIEKGNTVPSAGDGTHPGRRRGKASVPGFNYSKALKAALDGARSIVTSRGDGKFEDGNNFAVSDANDAQAKFAHLTPDTLAPGNVEGIIQQRDQLQITASCAQRGPAEIASGDSRGRTGHPPLQQHAAALAMSANILYDINDEDAGVGNQAAGRAASRAIAATPPTTSAVAAAGGPGPSANPKGIQTPEYVLQEVPGGPTRHSQLEILILLPSVSSPEEVHVWLSSEGELQVAVPAKYHLKLELPYPVLDDTSYAKWSKAKKRLTLMLTKKG